MKNYVEGNDHVIVWIIMPEFPHRNREKLRQNRSGYAVSWLSTRWKFVFNHYPEMNKVVLYLMGLLPIALCYLIQKRGHWSRSKNATWSPKCNTISLIIQWVRS